MRIVIGMLVMAFGFLVLGSENFTILIGVGFSILGYTIADHH